NEFVREPSKSLRLEFNADVHKIARAVAYIQTNGDDADRALIQKLRTDYGPRLIEVNATLDAILAGQQVEDTDLAPNRLIAELKQVLGGPEQERKRTSVQKLQEYQKAQKVQAAIVLMVLAFGLPVMAGLLLLIRVF